MWCFSVPWGSCAEDVLLVSEWLARNRHRRLAVITDDLWHWPSISSTSTSPPRDTGSRSSASNACPRPCATPPMHPPTSGRSRGRPSIQPGGLARRPRAPGPLSLAAVAGAVTEQGWDIPKVANNAFAAAQRPERAASSRVGSAPPAGTTATSCSPACCRATSNGSARPVGPDFAAAVYDGARVLFEALSLAPSLDRPGVRAGLERVRNLPSAMGSPENVLTLGPWDHRALKGRTMMVLRRIEGGRSVMEERRGSRRDSSHRRPCRLGRLRRRSSAPRVRRPERSIDRRSAAEVRLDHERVGGPRPASPSAMTRPRPWRRCGRRVP